MPLYHATRRILQPNELGKPQGLPPLYPNIGTALDPCRLPGMPLRVNGVFAAETIVAATAFLLAEEVPIEAIRVYEVIMPVSHRGPFAVVSQIERRFSAGRPYQALVDEYWKPSRDWMFWEHFGPNFTVIKQVTTVSAPEAYAFSIRYQNPNGDFEQAQRI